MPFVKYQHTSLWFNMLACGSHLMGLGIRQVAERGKETVIMQYRVQFDNAFVLTVSRPAKNIEAERGGCIVETGKSFA